ncbi:putative oxidase protein [Neofusicoccum parvum UCRNP2]|uniref:Putative oxidase protein n=1 Tax=Botryosphaeria parva (strain UCR-NP2) TaxID=1287680 RepID=R1GW61_BOTPV|nr:putative oxidase protein [Neofusicoccum parvum UCRNP2]
MKSTFMLALLLAMLGMVMAAPAPLSNLSANPSSKLSPDRLPAVGFLSTPFDPKDQLIDVTGTHAFVHPHPGDARGPCPGLNALANHGYISHDGVTNHDELIKALIDVFAMDYGVAEYLTLLGMASSGSVDMWTLSIGGHHPRTDENVTFAVKVPTRGLSGTHIVFETDASPTRSDLYDARSVDHPDDVHMNIEFFKQLFDRQAGIADEDVDFSLEVVAEHKFARTIDSVENNPDMFLSPANAAMGSMAAHLFISSFMSNHSAEHPEGRLDRQTLKSFFGVTEDEELGLSYNSGGERIPDNWYRRHSARPYRVEDLNADIRYTIQKHPTLLNDFFVGGNADGRADNWQSVDIEKLTSGNYSISTITTEPNHPACFAIEAGPVFTQPYMEAIYEDIWPVAKILNEVLIPIVKPLGCPRWMDLDASLFDGLRGYERSFDDFDSAMLG